MWPLCLDPILYCHVKEDIGRIWGKTKTDDDPFNSVFFLLLRKFIGLKSRRSNCESLKETSSPSTVLIKGNFASYISNKKWGENVLVLTFREIYRVSSRNEWAKKVGARSHAHTHTPAWYCVRRISHSFHSRISITLFMALKASQTTKGLAFNESDLWPDTALLVCQVWRFFSLPPPPRIQNKKRERERR